MVIKKGRYNIINKKFKLNNEKTGKETYISYSDISLPKLFAAELAMLQRKKETIKAEEIVEFAHRLGFGDFVEEEAKRINTNFKERKSNVECYSWAEIKHKKLEEGTLFVLMEDKGHKSGVYTKGKFYDLTGKTIEGSDGIYMIWKPTRMDKMWETFLS